MQVPHGAPPGIGTWGELKDLLGPFSSRKISPIPKPYHLHLGPTILTVYSSFRCVGSQFNGSVHSDGCKTQRRVKWKREERDREGGREPRGVGEGGSLAHWIII
eukprot:TRINITY_DN878_c1_g3_i1.p1 TRINITY_DN878_c1_g3~~TRINITY_DN878_c1_g3_i1.p1  ORF type:complete len:104 (+),score=7.90 TRINITY_DN878_c1_g3_i1:324-635(+)